METCLDAWPGQKSGYFRNGSNDLDISMIVEEAESIFWYQTHTAESG